ncbi:MAG: hypothetical protein KGY76_07280 [Candidatus Thermoplasmatota archaeon]|nr:hypothetical protein [Candidatus Thermoplasmatota archaeon]
MNNSGGSGSDDDFSKCDREDPDSQTFGEPHSKEEGKETPLGIKILTALFIINGIIALLTVASGLTWDLDFFHKLIVGVAAFPIAYGLWKGLSWGRIAGIIIVLLAIAVPIFNLIRLKEGASTVSLILNIFLLVYLFKGNVKDYFSEDGKDYSKRGEGLFQMRGLLKGVGPLFEKEIEVDRSLDKLYKPALDQLERDHNLKVKDSSENKIEVKFGSRWSVKDNKRGSAEVVFEKKKTIDVEYGFFSEILISTLVIYFPLLFVVGFAAYGGVYIISVFMAVILLVFLKYHHHCFKKTADNYHSKLKKVFFVLDSDEFTFCETCGYELDVGEGHNLEKCPSCGSDVRKTR